MLEKPWNLTREKKPKLPENEKWCSVQVICAQKESKNPYILVYCRRQIRGKVVERWEYVWGNICYCEPYCWRYMPGLPNGLNEGEEEK